MRDGISCGSFTSNQPMSWRRILLKLFPQALRLPLGDVHVAAVLDRAADQAPEAQEEHVERECGHVLEHGVRVRQRRERLAEHDHDTRVAAVVE